MNEDLTKKLPQSDSEKLTLILTTVQNLEVRLEKLEQWVDNIDSRLQRLEQKVEQRLYDTRPIWHKVVADIAQLQVGQQRLEEGQEALRREIRELNSSVREVSRDQIVINQVIRQIQLDLINRNPSNSST
jgi:predicted  nucleic acid-binding Zn-ribbon protein